MRSGTKEAAMAIVAAAPKPIRRRLGTQARREERWFYLLISPWILGFIIFLAGPILASSYLSLTFNDPIHWPPKWVGLANYDHMLHDPIFWTSLRVTFYYVIVSVPLSVVTATIVALLLNQRIPFVGLWRTIYYLPAVTSGVAVALLWQWIFQPTYGLLDGVLYDLFHIQGPQWLVDQHWSMPALIMISLWQFGGPMLIYLAAIQNVPTSLYEAAELDGAGRFQRMWRVTIPLITPVIFFNVIMNIIASFQVFTNAYIITQGGPNYSTYVYVLNIYNNAFVYIGNMGYADALSWLLFVVMLAFTLLAFKSAQFWVYYENPEAQAAR
jgi:multiple sugar transport system permease protein